MKVSVITPVYNAAEFVTRAVESALAQPEVVEVLLIEDGSPDNSLEVCQGLAAKYEKFRLLRHPNGENRGAGASRNLGMRNASCEYIGFVDADNFYLPGRFDLTKQVFESNPDCEGVYETIGNYVQDEAGLRRWTQANRQPDKLTGLTEAVSPDHLGEILIRGGSGSLTLDGLLIKKSVLAKSGLMNETLRLHQDTDFIIRCALVARLYPGQLNKPVALRGVHDHNRLSAPRSKAQEYKNRMAYWMSLYHWAKKNATKEIQHLICDAIFRYSRSHKYFNNFPIHIFPTKIIYFTRYLRLLAYPEILLDNIKK